MEYKPRNGKEDAMSLDRLYFAAFYGIIILNIGLIAYGVSG